MGMQVTDADGNKVELPVEKVEDITSAIEASKRVTTLEKDLETANKAAHPDWPATRSQIKALESELATAKARATELEANGGKANPPAPIDEAKARELGKQSAQEVVAEENARKIEAKRDRLLDEISGGDVNRKKVIMEQYKRLTGDKKVTDEDEMLRNLSDARTLSGQTRNRESHAFDGGGGSGRGPNRAGSGPGGSDVGHGAQLATGMGYRPKSDVSKLTQ